MRSLLSLSVVAAIVLGYALPVMAMTEVEVDGQIRFRTEFDDRYFGPDPVSDEDLEMAVFHLLRTRLGVGATVADNARFYFQAQDSRKLGDGPSLKDSQSGGLMDTHNVDVHQAYLKIMNLWADGLGLKLGRFEVNLGNERVFGSVGWSNVGRSWEGAMAWYKMEKLKLSGMALKRFEPDGPFEQSIDNSDFNVYGIVANLADPAFQFFFTYEQDADDSMVLEGASLEAGLAADGDEDDCNNLDRMTVGAFYKNNVEDMNIDYAFNAAYQFGNIHGPYGEPSLDEYDISAYMINLELGYNIEGDHPARLAGAIDYTSGDDDGTDTDWGAYNNLYYTGHKWRGFMDYFVSSNTSGLVDLMGRAHVELFRDWWLMGDFHYFQTAEEYVNPLVTDETTSDVGMEIDLTLKTKSIAGAGMMAGASFFMPEDAFAGLEDPDTGMWFYYQFVVNFK